MRLITYGLGRAKNEWGCTYTSTIRHHGVQRDSITFCFFTLHVTCVLRTSRMLLAKHLPKRKMLCIIIIIAVTAATTTTTTTITITTTTAAAAAAAIEFSLSGSSPYSSTDKQIRINIHK